MALYDSCGVRNVACKMNGPTATATVTPWLLTVTRCLVVTYPSQLVLLAIVRFFVKFGSHCKNLFEQSTSFPSNYLENLFHGVDIYGVYIYSMLIPSLLCTW